MMVGVAWSAPVLGRRSDQRGLLVDRDGLGSGACAPRQSCDQTRDAPENGPQEGLVGVGRRQVKPDHRLQLDPTRGNLDQAKAQGALSSSAPVRVIPSRLGADPLFL